MTNHLPTHPAYYLRNVPVGPIPVPTLLTEEVPADRLSIGDVVIVLDQICTVHPQTTPTVWHCIFGTGRFDAYGMYETETAVRVVGITFGTLEQSIKLADLRDDSWTSYGKFDDQASEYLYGLALEESNYCGSCDEIGWTATLVTHLRRDATLWQYAPIVDNATADEGTYPIDSWLAEAGMPSAAIVWNDDRGFVSVDWFGDEETARAAYRLVEDDANERMADDEEDETEDEENPYAILGGLLDEIRYAESFLTDEEK